MTTDNIAINSTNFSVNKNGAMTCSNATITGGKFTIANSYGDGNTLSVTDRAGYKFTADGSFVILRDSSNSKSITMNTSESDEPMILVTRGSRSCVITSTGVNAPSLETCKKNFEKYDNALETIKDIDIYKYNYKEETDDTKKHIGFVIGKDYNYSKEVTSIDNNGVDLYSFTSLCCQAIKEQQQEIELLKQEIELLKGGKINE